MRIHKTAFLTLALVLVYALVVLAQTEPKSKPKLTLDEFFNSVSITTPEISPDGNAVVIGAERADWDQQIFRDDLWLYRDDGKSGTLVQLTQSGHDSEPKWSPDGRWIAFLSERKASSEKDADADDDKSKSKNKSKIDDNHKDAKDKDEVSQIYVISPTGGEAIPLTQGEEEVHTFSWSADSRTLYFATRNPWTKTQKDDYKKEWKDVIQYRTAERGDTIFALDVAAALARQTAAPAKEESDAGKESDLTPGANAIAVSPVLVEEMVISPDGSRLAFVTNSINQRQEKNEDIEIYALNLSVARTRTEPEPKAPSPANAGNETKLPTPEPRQLTH